jgi:two-component system sensor kinase ParS
VRLLWRDLEALRRHADRIGSGDLQARAQVSPRSQIRVIVDHSNRMAARVAELVQRQRDLTHAISHELRTPIARMAFGLDLMQDSDDRERRERLAQGLHGDLAELNRLVSELLAYERLEHPSEGEPMQRIEANDWLQACLADARRDAERAGIVLRVQPSALPRVDAEPRLLQLALSNLVGNALRHARSQVEVSLVGISGRACCVWMMTARHCRSRSGEGDAPVHPPGRQPQPRYRRLRPGPGHRQPHCRPRHGGELRISRATLGGARLEMHWPLAAS